MNAAQVAVACLVAVLVGAAVTLIIVGEMLSGWIFGSFALFGFVMLLGMIVTNEPRRGRRE